MAANFNKVIIAGNLTRDPEYRQFEGDRSVASFGMAISRKYRSRDGELQESVVFVDIEAWSKTADLVAEYLSKGSPCLVEGRLKLDQWEDREGNRRSKLKVVADNVQFLSDRRDPQAEQPQPQRRERRAQRQEPQEYDRSQDDDEPPF